MKHLTFIIELTLQHHSTVTKNFFMSFVTMKNTSMFLLHGTIEAGYGKGPCDPVGGVAKRNADMAGEQ